MTNTKPNGEPQPSEDDVLRRMLKTPPQPFTPKPKAAAKRVPKPAK